MSSLEVTLVCGVRRAGTARRNARVRPLSVDEERGLVDAADTLLPAELATRLLERSAEVAGETGADLARELTIGDRAALLLAFHRLTAGEALPCLADCTACGVRFELEVDASSLLVERSEPPHPVLEAEVRGTRIEFRLPTGVEEERAARAALEDPDAAAEELLRACVVADGGLPLDVLAGPVEAAIAESDPYGEIDLGFTCPECGSQSSAVLEPTAYVLDELRARTAELEREIHALASTYGWDEAEILALPAARRRRYLDLIEAVESR